MAQPHLVANGTDGTATLRSKMLAHFLLLLWAVHKLVKTIFFASFEKVKTQVCNKVYLAFTPSRQIKHFTCSFWQELYRGVYRAVQTHSFALFWHALAVCTFQRDLSNLISTKQTIKNKTSLLSHLL